MKRRENGHGRDLTQVAREWARRKGKSDERLSEQEWVELVKELEEEDRKKRSVERRKNISRTD